MDNLSIREIRDAGGDILDQVLGIYEEAFPIEERIPTENLRSMIRQTSAATDHVDHWWAGIDQPDRVWGMASFSYYCATRWAYLPFLAIHNEERGRGLGGYLFQEVLLQVKEDAIRLDGKPGIGLCFEVERPQDGHDDAEREKRQRRIRFYERNGAFVINGVDFVAPPLGHGFPALPLILMACPMPKAAPLVLDRALTKDVVDTVLRYGYGAGADNPYYVAAMESIGK